MANKLESLRELFSNSLEDHILSRSEKKDLKKHINELQLNQHDRQVLRSDVRKLAEAHSQDPKQQLVLNWMYEAFKVLEAQKQEEEPSSILFSPGTECREAICSQIRFATSKIRICVFTISDDEITEEIINAHKMGKSVKIITDNEKQFDKGSDIQRMMDLGIPTVVDKTSAHMHHKFALFDDHTVLTGSYNWTRSAATHNHENILILEDPKVFRAYKNEFDSLWEELKD